MKREIRRTIEKALEQRTPNRKSNEFYPLVDKMDTILKRLTTKLKDDPYLTVYIPCCGAIPWEMLLILDAKLKPDSTLKDIKTMLYTIKAYDINKTCVNMSINTVIKYIADTYNVKQAQIRYSVKSCISVKDIFSDKGDDIRCLLSCNPPFYGTLCKKIVKRILRVYANAEELSIIVPYASYKVVSDMTSGRTYESFDWYGVNLGVRLKHLHRRTSPKKATILIDYVNNGLFYTYLSSLAGNKADLRFVITNNRLLGGSSLNYLGMYDKGSIENILNGVSALYIDIRREFHCGKGWAVNSESISLHRFINSLATKHMGKTSSNCVKMAYAKTSKTYKYESWDGTTIYTI